MSSGYVSLRAEIEIRFEDGRVFSGEAVDIRLETTREYASSFVVGEATTLEAKILNTRISSSSEFAKRDRKSGDKPTTRPLADLPNKRAIILD